MDRQAPVAHPVNTLIRTRWSPTGFGPEAVSREDLTALFEAARWAASSFNAQPWRYIVGRRGDACFERILGCLIPAGCAVFPGRAAWEMGIHPLALLTFFNSTSE
jgi:hypothetical protein